MVIKSSHCETLSWFQIEAKTFEFIHFNTVTYRTLIHGWNTILLPLSKNLMKWRHITDKRETIERNTENNTLILINWWLFRYDFVWLINVSLLIMWKQHLMSDESEHGVMIVYPSLRITAQTRSTESSQCSYWMICFNFQINSKMLIWKLWSPLIWSTSDHTHTQCI